MKTYKCHKTVKAAKIEGVFSGPCIVPAGGPFNERVLLKEGETCIVMEDDIAVIFQDQDRPHLSKAEPGGYYIVYDDGYTSFSPARAFEAGYSPI
jgi:hypothetical protein